MSYTIHCYALHLYATSKTVFRVEPCGNVPADVLAALKKWEIGKNKGKMKLEISENKVNTDEFSWGIYLGQYKVPDEEKPIQHLRLTGFNPKRGTAWNFGDTLNPKLAKYGILNRNDAIVFKSMDGGKEYILYFIPCGEKNAKAESMQLWEQAKNGNLCLSVDPLDTVKDNPSTDEVNGLLF